MTAYEFARKAHEGQMYGEHPYTVHLFDVQQIALQVNDPALSNHYLSAVAFLHDVVEDTEVTVDEVRAEFGEFVAGAVELLTDPEGPNRKARKALLHERLSQLDKTRIDERAALIVKTADRCANVRAANSEGREDLLKMYRGEHPDFQRAVWRPGLCDSLWEELTQLLGA